MSIKYIILIIIVFFMIYVYNNNENENFTKISTETIATKYYADKNITLPTLSVTEKFNMLPKGSVLMWYSKTAVSVPEGWLICDGTNGTPDLRGRFVIGTNAAFNMNVLGGEEQHVLLMNEMPAHNHIADGKEGYKLMHPQTGHKGLDGGGHLTYNAGDGSDKPLSDAIGNVGTNAPHNNMPPYYVLTYIMKEK